MNTPILKQPKRIQRLRTRGWTKPAGTIYVGRPTIYGNPFHIDGTYHRLQLGVWTPAQPIPNAAVATNLYREWLTNPAGRFFLREPHHGAIHRGLADLRGHDLCCWCPTDSPCHADVLLELANA